MNIIDFTASATQATIYTAPASTIVKVEFIYLNAQGGVGLIHIDSTQAIQLGTSQTLIPDGDQLQMASSVSPSSVQYYGFGVANIANRGGGYIPNYYYLTGGQALKVTYMNGRAIVYEEAV
jgi:hypothetical protein